MTSQRAAGRVNQRLTSALATPDRRLLTALLLVALALRVGAVVALRAWQHPITWENGAIAHSIVEGHGFSFDYREGEISNYYTLPRPEPTSFQAPFYPYLLAAFQLLGRELGQGRALALLLLLQAAVGAALVIPVFFIGRRLFGPPVAVVGAAIAAVYPGLVYAATVPHQAVWAVTGFSVAFLGLVHLRQRPTLGAAAAYGALFGLLLLMEPVFLALMAAAFVGVWLSGKPRIRIAAAGGVALAAAMLVISPWLVRGYLVHGRFVCMKSSGGFNLWQGNNPAANGTPHSGWKHVPYPAPPELLARLRGAHDELARDAIWRAAAVSEMRAHPRRAAILWAKKALFFWTITPYHQLTRSPWYWAPYSALLVLAAASLATMRGRLRGHLPTLLAFAAATVVYSITFPGPRYRMPLEPLLFLFSAQGILVAARLIAARAPQVGGHPRQVGGRA
jgi:hypothetical protein